MASVKDLMLNFMKLDKFLGVKFKKWQKKMLILLTSLNVAYAINTPKPKEKDDETLEDTRKRNKWENNDLFVEDTSSIVRMTFFSIFINFMNPLRYYEIV